MNEARSCDSARDLVWHAGPPAWGIVVNSVATSIGTAGGPADHTKSMTSRENDMIHDRKSFARVHLALLCLVCGTLTFTANVCGADAPLELIASTTQPVHPVLILDRDDGR